MFPITIIFTSSWKEKKKEFIMFLIYGKKENDSVVSYKSIDMITVEILLLCRDTYKSLDS